tara:strand:- start:61 stop:288 length:228 start_codon:yes stop_codon:yes gene_type:complete
MKTYLSKVFYFLGDAFSIFLRYDITNMIVYPMYRRLMLMSISLDKNNIVWENKERKESLRVDLILKINNENKFRH